MKKILLFFTFLLVFCPVIHAREHLIIEEILINSIDRKQKSCDRDSLLGEELLIQIGKLEQKYNHFWESNKSVIHGNRELFENYCQITGISYIDFLDVINDQNNRCSPSTIEYLGKHKKCMLLRNYTQLERDGLFVYLNGYTSLLMQATEEIQDIIESKDDGTDHYSILKSALNAVLTQMITGNIKASVVVGMTTLLANYTSEYTLKWFYPRSMDELQLYAARIEKVEWNLATNLRPLVK